jgi:hypothetical protein
MNKTENIPNDTNDINRKEAIKKMGKYAALTAMGTFMILNPKKALAASGPSEPGAW